jgi:hypothetical protein
MGIRRGPSIVKDGLVLCLDAALPKSYPGTGNTWYDLSGNGYNATLVNSPSFNNINRGSILFNGTGDYASVLNYSSFESLNTSEVTIEIFASITYDGTFTPLVTFYPTSRSSQPSSLGFGNHTGYWSNESLDWYMASSYLWFAYTNGHDYFQDGQVRQYVLTLKTNNYQVYVNGNKLTLNSSFRFGNQATSMITDLFSNGMYIAYDTNFNGSSVSRLSIYDKILSDQQIRQNYEATRGRFESFSPCDIGVIQTTTTTTSTTTTSTTTTTTTTTTAAPTTTTTTTTTLDPSKYYCYENLNDANDRFCANGAVYAIYTAIGGPYDTESECLAGCEGASTSTTTSTTSTTSTITSTTSSPTTSAP